MPRQPEVRVGEDTRDNKEICLLDRETLIAILDNVYKGVVCCDKQGLITFFSRSNEKFYGLERGEALGKHINDFVKTGTLHKVARTGRPEIGLLEEEHQGKQVRHIIERWPINKDGQVVGAIAKVMFSDIKKAEELARHFRKLEDKVMYYRSQLRDLFQARYKFEHILGDSPALADCKEMACQVAPASSTVMITGESGTGKELFAHAIHNASPRSGASFIRVNCASVPPDLFESEFFGYDEGAFTGAKRKGMKGKFQLADRGTIFLDEVSEIPIYLQAKLLRVIQEKEVQRIGSDRVVPIDFRIIASSNRDLAKMVAAGEFREDLYYRMNVVGVKVPALRHRKEDLQVLVPAFIKELNGKLSSKVEGVSPEALKALLDYDWPGNVRELKNTMERAMALAQTSLIQIEHLPRRVLSHDKNTNTNKADALPLTLKAATEHAEAEAIQRALLVSGGNKVKAAKFLGIHRSALYKKMHHLGLIDNSGPSAE